MRKGVRVVAGVDFSAIKAAMTCAEFAAREGLPMRGKRAKCPWNHAESRHNLQFMRDGNCYCHACGRGGDVLQLAAAVWTCDTLSAARMLAGELGIAADGGGNWREQRAQRERERERKAQRDAEQRKLFSLACDQLHKLETAAARFGVDDAEHAETWQVVKQLADTQDRIERVIAEGRENQL